MKWRKEEKGWREREEEEKGWRGREERGGRDWC